MLLRRGREGAVGWGLIWSRLSSGHLGGLLMGSVTSYGAKAVEVDKLLHAWGKLYKATRDASK